MNVITTDFTYGFYPTSTGVNTLEEPDARNITNCCEAVMAGLSRYIAISFTTTSVNPDTLIIIVQTELITEEIYLDSLLRIYKCSSINCCVGAAEGLTSIAAKALDLLRLLITGTLNSDILIQSVTEQSELLVTIALRGCK